MAENYLCHEMMKSYNGNDKVICLTFFCCVLSHFSSLWALEGGVVRVTSSSTWSLVVNIYLMGRHVSCMLDQSVTLIRSFSSPVWTFSTFSSFIKTDCFAPILPSTANACFGLCLHDDFYSRTERTLRQNLENIFR